MMVFNGCVWEGMTSLGPRPEQRRLESEAGGSSITGRPAWACSVWEMRGLCVHVCACVCAHVCVYTRACACIWSFTEPEAEGSQPSGGGRTWVERLGAAGCGGLTSTMSHSVPPPPLGVRGSRTILNLPCLSGLLGMRRQMGSVPGRLWKDMRGLCPGEAQSKLGKYAKKSGQTPPPATSAPGAPSGGHAGIRSPEAPGSPIRLSGFCQGLGVKAGIFGDSHRTRRAGPARTVLGAGLREPGGSEEGAAASTASLPAPSCPIPEDACDCTLARALGRAGWPLSRVLPPPPPGAEQTHLREPLRGATSSFSCPA